MDNKSAAPSGNFVQDILKSYQEYLTSNDTVSFNKKLTPILNWLRTNNKHEVLREVYRELNTARRAYINEGLQKLNSNSELNLFNPSPIEAAADTLTNEQLERIYSYLHTALNSKVVQSLTKTPIPSILQRFSSRLSSSGSCPTCIKATFAPQVLPMIRQHVSQEDLVNIFGNLFIEDVILLMKSKVRINDNDNVARTSCENCLTKHLSQALVITDELRQGYAPHIKFVKYHIHQAMQKTKDKHVIAKLESIMLDVEGAVNNKEAAIMHLKYVKQALIDLSEGNVNAWRIIGHLGEAADEIWDTNPELANLIREERLKFMDDNSYNINIEALLSGEALQSKKAIKPKLIINNSGCNQFNVEELKVAINEKINLIEEGKRAVLKDELSAILQLKISSCGMKGKLRQLLAKVEKMQEVT
jgi:hypothetical protein